jgi:hypothetical protein
MARRFVRVDLSEVARDFRPVALEPGLPLLDRSQANARILHQWLGGLVAEPEWEGESVNFYVCDSRGGRLEDVVCEPASEAELRGPLKAELENLRQRIARIKPETSTERGVHKTLQREFAKLADDEYRTDHGCFFFRYKDAAGRWRLVWCWGYQRADQHPAAVLVCRDPGCNLLFVRRSGQSGKCPGCQALQALPSTKRKLTRRHLLVGLLLLLLIALLISKKHLNPPREVARHVAQAPMVETAPHSEPKPDKASPPEPNTETARPSEPETGRASQPEPDVEKMVDGKEQPREKPADAAPAKSGPGGDSGDAQREKPQAKEAASLPERSKKNGENGSQEKPRPNRPDVVPPPMAMNQRAPVSVVTAVEKTARFQTVRPTISDQFVPEFTVTLEITADRSDRPLEYRGFVTGQSPPEAWTPAVREGNFQRAVVTSPPIRTGPFSTVYDLTLEARDPADGSIERSPLRFRLSPEVDVEPPADENNEP